MTPEQLREWADAIDGEKPWAPKAADVIDQLRAHAAALEELAKLRARLEIDPRHSYDGIAARDETIRLLEAALAESERRGERLKFYAEAAMSWIEEHHNDHHDYLPDFVDAYRAEFKEE